MDNLITPLRQECLTPDVLLHNISVGDCSDKKYAIVLTVSHEGDVSIYDNFIPKSFLKVLAMELLEFALERHPSTNRA